MSESSVSYCQSVSHSQSVSLSQSVPLSQSLSVELSLGLPSFFLGLVVALPAFWSQTTLTSLVRTAGRQIVFTSSRDLLIQRVR